MELLIFIFAGVLILLVKNFFPSYFGKKGENLATKEDVEEVTEKIESMKATIGSQLYIHQTRYQNEYVILKDLSEKLVDLRDAALGLRPTVDHINPNESEDDRKQRRLRTYFDAARNLYKLCETRRPFYPVEIYRGTKKLDNIIWKEAVQYKHGSSSEGSVTEYWDKATANANEISKVADEVIELIRHRVDYWEQFELNS